MPEFKNPHNFKLVSTRVTEIPNSPLLCIALAFNSGQYYAAAVDRLCSKNYVLHANIDAMNPKRDIIYKDIIDESEHRAISTFFQKSGVFELFYKGSNWLFTRQNKEDLIPPWFQDRYLRK